MGVCRISHPYREHMYHISPSQGSGTIFKEKVESLQEPEDDYKETVCAGPISVRNMCELTGGATVCTRPT